MATRSLIAMTTPIGWGFPRKRGDRPFTSVMARIG